jgi:hypothetical protein
MASFSNLAMSLPDAEMIRRTAQEVAHRPEFQIRPVYSNRALIDLAWRILRPIIRFFSGLWDISPVLAWVVTIGLTLLCVLLIAHIVYTIRQAITRRTQFAGGLGREAIKIDPVELERKAEDAAAREEFITAVRLLLKASLLRISLWEERTLRLGATNGEHMRRYRQSKFIGALAQLVNVVDAKWYGSGLCDAQDYRACRLAHAQICSAVEVTHAHGT